MRSSGAAAASRSEVDPQSTSAAGAGRDTGGPCGGELPELISIADQAAAGQVGDEVGVPHSRPGSATSAGSAALEWQSSRSVLARLSGQLSLPAN